VGGRLPGPILLEKLLWEVLRDDVEGARDETEDAKDVSRAPTRDVPLIVERVPAVEDVPERTGSPARSTKVFLFGSASLTKRIEAKDQLQIRDPAIALTHKRNHCFLSLYVEEGLLKP
jgi:hypothetical protein